MPRSGAVIENDQGNLPPIDPNLGFGGGSDGDPDRSNRGSQRSTSLLGLAIGMIASTMTFAALASTLILRHALSPREWVSLPVPSILWPNTALLIVSSIFLEAARHALNKQRRRLFNALWWTGITLGMGFLAGQTIAWLQLRASGVYLNTNPSHGLFYILTWTHAAHAVGGMIALLWVGIAALRYRLGPRKRTVVIVSSVFWHFLDVMWLCLMGLFLVWG